MTDQPTNALLLPWFIQRTTSNVIEKQGKPIEYEIKVCSIRPANIKTLKKGFSGTLASRASNLNSHGFHLISLKPQEQKVFPVFKFLADDSLQFIRNFKKLAKKVEEVYGIEPKWRDNKYIITRFRSDNFIDDVRFSQFKNLAIKHRIFHPKFKDWLGSGYEIEP